MTAVEALLRWSSPRRGSVSPVDFIPLAEGMGLILPLGQWVLRQACEQLLGWDAEGGDPQLRIAVNVSPRQLERPGLLEELDACLARGLAAFRIILEITETALTLDDATAQETLLALRERGVQIAIDDFGTGYSSLALLSSAPVSRLKIDRALVGEIEPARPAAPIIDATITMAAGLGLDIVAEGVETGAQLAYLRDAGCEQAQGFLLARPMAPLAAARLVHGFRPWEPVLRSRPETHPATRLASGPADS